MVQTSPALTLRPPAGADEVERLRQQVADLRGAIGRDVGELESRLRETFDLRRQISRHPFVAAALVIGGAVVLASVVASLLRSARRSGVPAPARRAR